MYGEMSLDKSMLRCGGQRYSCSSTVLGATSSWTDGRLMGFWSPLGVGGGWNEAEEGRAVEGEDMELANEAKAGEDGNGDW